MSALILAMWGLAGRCTEDRDPRRHTIAELIHFSVFLRLRRNTDPLKVTRSESRALARECAYLGRGAMSAEMETESIQQRGEGEGAAGEGAAGELKKYSWEEVKQHSTSESAWVVLHDKVYDVTEFLDEVKE